MTAQPWTFGDPAGPGDLFNARDHIGRLVAFVQPSREEVTTKFGDDTATRCRYIVILDGEAPGEVRDNPLVFGNLGQNAWANGDHAIVLGRIAQSEAKPGQNPAYILDPADEDDKTTAKTWFDTYGAMNSAGHIVLG